MKGKEIERECSKAAKSNQFLRFEDKHLTLLPSHRRPPDVSPTDRVLPSCLPQSSFYVEVRPPRKLFTLSQPRSRLYRFFIISNLFAQRAIEIYFRAPPSAPPQLIKLTPEMAKGAPTQLRNEYCENNVAGTQLFCVREIILLGSEDRCEWSGGARLRPRHSYSSS